MVIKKESKKCLNCSKIINPKLDYYVQIGTHNIPSGAKDDIQQFHFMCWVEYFNKCVEKKARHNIQIMQSKAMQVFNSPMIKSLLSQVKGSDQVLQMLGTPLEQNKVLILKAEKTKDGRNKKRARHK